MKILINWLGAFWFAIAYHLGKNNPEIQFDWWDINQEILKKLETSRQHPYFFEDAKLPHNINILHSQPKRDSYDILLNVIPAQFIKNWAQQVWNNIKSWAIIVNLAKGIDNQHLKLPFEIIKQHIGIPFKYGALWGGMIAQELIEQKPLGADIGIASKDSYKILANLFENENLQINYLPDPAQVELGWSLKNIIALWIGYREGQGLQASSLGKYLIEIILEVQQLAKQFFKVDIKFESYSFGGDIVATAFGNSRNRLMGKLVGEGKSSLQAIQILKSQKKHAEGWETLKGFKKLIYQNSQFPILNQMIKLFEV